MTYLLSEDYASAREYSLRLMPFLADRELWQQEITDNQVIECELAGALLGAGDETGRDLLQLFIRNYETLLAGGQSVFWVSSSMKYCYLLEGSYEKALDILDGEATSGRIIGEWWRERMLPWWALVADHPRYQELAGRIDEMLDEQRALLP